jgi:hypothetical protein
MDLRFIQRRRGIWKASPYHGELRIIRLVPIGVSPKMLQFQVCILAALRSGHTAGALRLCLVVSIISLLGASPVAAQAPGEVKQSFNDKPTAEQLAFFEKKIRPLFVEHCYKCHSTKAETTKAEKLRGGLLLENRAGIRAGGEGGPVIIPGDIEQSRLIRAVRYQDESFQIPPTEAPKSAIADLEAWFRLTLGPA